MDKEKTNAVKLENREMKKVAGGFPGEYGYVESYNCPRCGRNYFIGQYCYSGQSTWTCTSCGIFTIIF